MRRPHDEVRPRLLVHREVEVALAVAGLRVGEAVEGVGQRRLDLREQHELVDGERGLAPPRPRRRPDDPDDVAEVDVDGAAAILGAEELEAAGAVDEVEERQLAVAAPGEHATGKTSSRSGLLPGLERLGLRPDGGDLVTIGKALRQAVHRCEPTDGAAGARNRPERWRLTDVTGNVIMMSWSSPRTSRPCETSSLWSRQPATSRCGRRRLLLSAGLEPGARLALMHALSDFAAEVTASLEDRVVELTLDGLDLRVAVSPAAGRPEERLGPEPGREEEGEISRISLRLPSALKNRAEIGPRMPAYR